MGNRLDLESKRVLVLAPTGRDSAAACALLQQAGMTCKACSSIEELRRELVAGAGAALMAEEAFFATDLSALFDWVDNQPPWSDFPFVVLTTHRDDPRVRRYTLDLIDKLRNVTLQERPIQSVTLVSGLQAALRARTRQYEVAEYLDEREQAANRLEALVRERTRQLQEANDQLVAAQENLTWRWKPPRCGRGISICLDGRVRKRRNTMPLRRFGRFWRIGAGRSARRSC